VGGAVDKPADFSPGWVQSQKLILGLQTIPAWGWQGARAWPPIAATASARCQCT